MMKLLGPSSLSIWGILRFVLLYYLHRRCLFSDALLSPGVQGWNLGSDALSWLSRRSQLSSQLKAKSTPFPPTLGTDLAKCCDSASYWRSKPLAWLQLDSKSHEEYCQRLYSPFQRRFAELLQRNSALHLLPIEAAELGLTWLNRVLVWTMVAHLSLLVVWIHTDEQLSIGW